MVAMSPSPIRPPNEKCSARSGRVLLWEKPPVACHCLTRDDGQVEVTLTSCDLDIYREVFGEFEDAARFAVDKMHAYDAR